MNQKSFCAFLLVLLCSIDMSLNIVLRFQNKIKVKTITPSDQTEIPGINVNKTTVLDLVEKLKEIQGVMAVDLGASLVSEPCIYYKGKE